ncbi:MAG: methionyl-tRNA formyltransferase [Flavobacteriales bacterium]|nr:methionyl-tRNA formyltransferase [Flavobacteriales bacterium]|tara:strand:+ start:986 stop:1600 length:615 start_codon:yes stop_codon:yes gene_type:complete
MELEYNTQREKLIISEYGRHIQKLVDHAANLNDRVERQKIAEGIIDLMGELNPHLRDVDDFKHKLWDHLFIMSDFKLDVNSPYEKPELEKLFEKPDPLAYPNSKIRFNHYGKVVEMMIEEASEMEKGELRDKLTLAIANQMKKSYVNWNRDSVEDKLIFKQLEQLSKGKLSLPEDTELASVSVLKKGNNNRKKKQNNKHRNKRY